MSMLFPERANDTHGFGRDGISGLVTTERAMRARDVSRPTEQDRSEAVAALDDLLKRCSGQRRQ